MAKLIKRDGKIVEFDKQKIVVAILKAMKYGSGIMNEEVAYLVADDIEKVATKEEEILRFEELLAMHKSTFNTQDVEFFAPQVLQPQNLLSEQGKTIFYPQVA